MTDILVTSPFRPFTLPTQFKAVFNGHIYCGTVDAVDPSVSQVQVYLVNESGDKVPVSQPLRTNAGGFLVYNGQPAKLVTDSNHSLLVRDSLGNQLWYAPDVSMVDPDAAYRIVGAQAFEALRRSYAEVGYNVIGTFDAGFTYVNPNDVGINTATGKGYTGPAGAVAPGTDPTSGGFVDRSGELLRLQIPRTSLLGVTSVESLVSLYPGFNSVIVDSDLTIGSAVTIPSGFVVKNGGGVVELTSDSARIGVTPNSKWYADVVCGGYSPDGLFYIDGKITTPRWYVGEHETEVKCKVSSNVTTGICALFDAVSSSEVRALISGVRIDITLSKMEFGAKLVVDRTAYTGPDTNNGYITSNFIKINGGGTIRLLHEQYSGDGTTRPSNEEIAANYYDLSHQPRSGYANYPMRMVGRIQRAVCNFWDSATATNTSDQIQIFGNDCDISGPNLPALNSGYVTISGSRCKYAGVTYGTPRDRANSTEYERGAYAKSGGTNIAFGGLISASSQSIAIRGTDSANGVQVLSKSLAPLSNQLPLVVDVDICASMVNSHPYKCAVSIGGATLNHVTTLVSGVINQIKIVLDGDSVSISSQAGDSVSQISSATFTAPLTLSVVVYSDSTATDCGYIRSHSAKAWLLGV